MAKNRDELQETLDQYLDPRRPTKTARHQIRAGYMSSRLSPPHIPPKKTRSRSTVLIRRVDGAERLLDEKEVRILRDPKGDPTIRGPLLEELIAIKIDWLQSGRLDSAQRVALNSEVELWQAELYKLQDFTLVDLENLTELGIDPKIQWDGFSFWLSELHNPEFLGLAAPTKKQDNRETQVTVLSTGPEQERMLDTEEGWSYPEAKVKKKVEQERTPIGRAIVRRNKK